MTPARPLALVAMSLAMAAALLGEPSAFTNNWSGLWPISARISSTRHAVIRGPSLTGRGNRPDFTPAHHVDLLTGMGRPRPTIEFSRTKPVSGKELAVDTVHLRALRHEGYALTSER